MRRTILGAVGILLWLITQAMGLGLTGAGHGWYGALLFSLPLILLYPAALIRTFVSRTESRDADIAIFAAAIILDLLLAANIFGAGNGYFLRMWELDRTFVIIWIALWSAWQPLVVVSLLRRRNAAAPDGGA